MNHKVMPTLLGDEYKPDWKGWPPHMVAGDLRVWEKIREKITAGAVRMFFDVGVGDGQPAPPGTSDELARMWLKSTQRRIDALIEYPNYVRIIELREDAHEQEIGRLEMYEFLYGKDPMNKKPIVLSLITAKHDPYIEEFTKTKGIEYIIV